MYGLKYLPDIIEDFKDSEIQSFWDYYKEKENQSGLVHDALPKIMMLMNYRNDMIDEFTYGHLSCDYDNNGFSGLMQSGKNVKGDFAQLFPAMAALQMKEGGPRTASVIDYVDDPESGFFRVSSVMYNSYLKFINIVLHELLMPDFLRDFMYVGSTRVNVSRLYSFDDRAGGFSHLIEEYFKNMSSKLSAKESDLQLNSRFYSVLYKAIQYVAESEGYSLVLKTSDADLVWYHTEIDITDKVIARVKASN